MEITTRTWGKRQRKPPKTTTTKTVKQFRAPRRSQSVIPGLLKQTGVEKKVIFFGDQDAINGALALNGTGSIIGLNFIQVGSSMFNRIGRKIEMRSVKLNAFMTIISAITRATTGPDYMRVSIVYDRQTNGSFPTQSDIYQDTEQSGANTDSATSGINMNNRERFVTIMDIRFSAPQATATAGVLTNVYPNSYCVGSHVNEFRKLRGLTTHYGADSNPAVVGDIRSGGLFIVSRGSNAAGAELFQMNWNLRMKYTDL